MPPNTVDTAVSNIRQQMDTSGWINPITNGEIQTVKSILSNLNAADTRAVVGKLSADELRQIADEMNDDSWFGNGGLSQGERRDFFNEMARDLGGAELAKLSQAFDRTTGRQTSRDRLLADDNITALGAAVGQHGSNQTKLDFIGQLAGASTDQSSIETMQESRLHDPQARAIAEVIGSMGNSPATAQQALQSLQPEQRQAVLKAATNEVLRVGGAMGGSGAVLTDTKPLEQLLKVASGIGDADTKARVFADAASVMTDLAGRGRPEAAENVRRAMGQLILSDTNGVMRELAANRETANGSALASYAKASLNAEDFNALGEIQAQISLGNAKNENPVARFEAQVQAPGGGQRFVNAETAGYYAGAVSAAVKDITQDAKEQGDLINATLKSVLTIVDKTAGRAHPAVGIGASVLKEWTQFGVKAAMDAKISGQVSADDKLFWALVPSVASRTLPNGRPDLEQAASSGAGSAFNGTWIVTREHAKP
ncbi:MULTISPECIES: hypothetical protein [unclassified Roseateles]|uniref:hypothetical protein n=1 Tax=unclassified Roseateles TaxID=2626991 RepID=UPI0007023495|nr:MULTISPECIES: hypothetical protein [unclassified Roseateles]KQW42052.1 hypothetical protein ASC81_22380 [Pelomonas sp. Root405]KRA67655.1 hypothetical protein ASD88_23965 [Pelomonas sp. Root662]